MVNMFVSGAAFALCVAYLLASNWICALIMFLCFLYNFRQGLKY